MLRPLLAFACLALTAFLLAPTVQSVHEQVEDLDIKRDLPRIWKWGRTEPPTSIIPPLCDHQTRHLFSEVDKWPPRIKKDETFTLGGFVRVDNAKGMGVGGVTVDLFLNETKELPGVALGTTTTGGDGRFTLTTSVPFDLQATKYHLVAHALEKQDGCIFYVEHWSDPEMEVTSPTTIVLYPVDDAVAGYPFAVRGRLMDSVGAPVRNANVTLSFDGTPRVVQTDAAGEFTTMHNVSSPRKIAYEARYGGSKYYGGSSAEGVIDVGREDLRLDASRLDLVRSRASTFGGRVVLPPGTQPQPLTFAFHGVKLSTCAGCPVASTVKVTPASDGTFSVTLFAGAAEPGGPFTANVTGGGLTRPHEVSGSVLIPVTLALDARDSGPLGHTLEGTVTLLDEVGRPYPGVVAVRREGDWVTGPVDAKGAYAFSMGSPCGPQHVQAVYNGSSVSMPATAQSEVTVCPLIAALPPWLLATPWWVWPLLALGVAAAVVLVRRWLLATAVTINRGPPLTLRHTLPDDAALGILGLGETATLTAYLEEPLPEGHALRMGQARRTVPVEVGPDLRATFTVTPDTLGETPIRAEILDAKGRVVSRRTATLRVVRYGQEIEDRYRRLRGASGVAAGVSPREFESWLRERTPDMDPAVASRLVGVFEEADYGPRDAGRRELIAYLEAENALPEVSPRAVA